jgi:peptidyl-prolyl cis-trans isomerase SurA
MRLLLLLAALLLSAPPPVAHAQELGIAAIVNGDVVSRTDVANRRRLFALSTGMPVTQQVLDRLTPQVIKQLIDERLRLQEIQRRRIVISDQEIAEAISGLEQRNGMAAGAMRARLQGQGVEFRTLIDQIRVQIGWSRVLRQVLGAQAEPTEAEIAERARSIEARTGQPEYLAAEIFVPVDDPANEEQARSFTNEVISQLRAGAPFPVVAAQFSQSPSALEGGDLGWVTAEQVDPEIARLLAAMPPGAVSNPVRVPGGFAIVTLRQKREVGRDFATMLSVRQAFLPFTAPLNPEAPTEQQIAQLQAAQRIQANARGCDAIEAANKQAGEKRPSDPGEVRLETINPPEFRQLLAGLAIGRASQPLPTPEGIMVIMVCSKEQKNLALASPQELRASILRDRVEQQSRRLMRDLRRRANITQRA